MPVLTLGCAILLSLFASTIVNSIANQPWNPSEGCSACPVQGAKIHMMVWLLWTTFFSSLAGMLLVWFATERNEPWKPMRKVAFAFNAFWALVAVILQFMYPDPLNALSHKDWFFMIILGTP